MESSGFQNITTAHFIQSELFPEAYALSTATATTDSYIYVFESYHIAGSSTVFNTKVESTNYQKESKRIIAEPYRILPPQQQGPAYSGSAAIAGNALVLYLPLIVFFVTLAVGAYIFIRNRREDRARLA